jgi:CHRD domain-containing protein
MKRLFIVTFALAIAAAGCSKSSPSTPSTPTKPTFTADLRPANENPPIGNAENTGSGTATITFDVTRDANNNVTGGTATFVVNLTGFPAGTPINIAHIHQGVTGTNGSIVYSTSLAAGEAVLTSGSGSFTKSGVTTTSGDPATIISAILANPAGFYFNVHSTLNPGGVARGQLVKVQ